MKKKYIFKELVIKDPYMYIFLCGSHFSKAQEDKRTVLKKYLQNQCSEYIPIILEENFSFDTSNTKKLKYDNIYLKNLYDVEMLMNYLVDANIIIHESISTGAETGLFLSEQSSIQKTCLLIPDKLSVEEEKYGNFMRLAFSRQEPKLRTITYYPQLKKNVISKNVCGWHTFFVDNTIGEHLGKSINDFLNSIPRYSGIKFTKSAAKRESGETHYSVNSKENFVLIELLPSALCYYITALLNIPEVQSTLFSKEYHPLSYYINQIVDYLKEVFINSIEEKTGKTIKKCVIKPWTNMKSMSITSVVGLILYLYQASEFITINKNPENENELTIAKHIKGPGFFYLKYADFIGTVIDTKVI